VLRSKEKGRWVVSNDLFAQKAPQVGLEPGSKAIFQNIPRADIPKLYRSPPMLIAELLFALPFFNTATLAIVKADLIGGLGNAHFPFRQQTAILMMIAVFV
jgi:hypothetical protein